MIADHLTTIQLKRYEIENATLLRDYPSLRDNIILREEMRYELYCQMVVSIRTWAVEGANGGVTQTFQTPATWWQLLKHDHAPAWFSKHYPVRYREQRYHVAFVCPHADIAWPGVEHLEFLAMRPGTVRRGNDGDE